MQYSAALLALVAGVNAHTLMSEIYVDGVGQGDGTCVRTPKSAYGAVNPITDLGSSDMACGKDGTMGVARTCHVNGGSSLTFEYRQWPDDPSKQSLDMGHMGPCSVYLKKVGNAVEDSGTGDGWFKLWDDGYDASADKWCTQKMIGNSGRITVTLPDSLAGGDYLVRPELLALHNVHKGIDEFYVGCAQVFLASSGSDGPESTVSIPGHVSKTDKALSFDPFHEEKPWNYPIPGPSVYSSMAKPSIKSNIKQADGNKPDSCILTNANWCGKELPSYSSEDGCWDADKDCWNQLDACYDEAPPTGSANCKIWEQKCKSNQQVCSSGNPNGPYNKGQSLQPNAAKISVPQPVNYGMSYGASGVKANVVDNSPAPSSSESVPAPSAESSDNSSNESSDNSNNDAPVYNAPAPAPTTTPAPVYNAPAPAPQTTTMATQVSAIPQQNNNNGNGDVNVVYETDWAYETVTQYATVTSVPQGYKHRRAHVGKNRMHI